MNAKPLVTKRNIDNDQQYCKGCEKNLPSNLFITNKKPYRTCNICRNQNKAVHQRKSQQSSTDQIPIEFYDLSDFLSSAFENATNNEEETQENKENLKFIFSCTINIITLEGDSKEKADHIIKIISDVDEYTWV